MYYAILNHICSVLFSSFERAFDMKIAFLTVFSALILAFASGCSFLARGEQIVSVTVTPSDASVIANGVEYHMLSPMFIEVPTRDALLITAYKPGYRTVFYAADSQLSTTGKIDAVGGIFILPALGLLSNGAWRFTESNIRIDLQPLPDPEELEIEQEATRLRRQEVARELNDQTIDGPFLPPTDATTRSSEIRSMDKHGVTVVSQEPLDRNVPEEDSEEDSDESPAEPEE